VLFDSLKATPSGRYLAVFSVAVVFLTAGLCAGPVSDPCELDALGCNDNAFDFSFDDSCELTGSLEVAVGQGEHGFVSFEPDESPERHHGMQGGEHIFLSLRVFNAAPDAYDKLRVSLGIFDLCAVGEVCDSVHGLEGGRCDEADVSAKSGLCEAVAVERVLVIGSATPMQVNSDGAVEESGLIMVTNGRAYDRGMIRVFVEDPCRREGWGEHHYGAFPQDTNAN
jgi:hypothetical protein